MRHVVVQQVADRSIEVGSIGTGEHHVEVDALLPVTLLAELLLDGLVEFRAGQWIGDTDADIVGARLLVQAPGGEDVVELLAQVPELQKEADPDPGVTQQAARMDILAYPRALV